MDVKRFLTALPVRAACLAGVWTCYQIALADRLGRRGDEASLREAISARPNHFLHYWQLARLDTPDSRQLLGEAIRLNPYNAGPIVDLAQALEAEGGHARAEQWLLEANRVDKTYFPRWSIANFYLRRGREDDFWKWARRAAEVGCEDITSLFDLCRRLEPDVSKLSMRLVPDRAHAAHNFLDYVAKRGLSAPPEACERAIRHAYPDRAHRLAIAVEGQLAARRFADAARTWAAMLDAKIVHGPGEVPEPDLGLALDWKLPKVEGAFTSRVSEGVEIHLTGQQPDAVALCERVLLLAPSTNYRVAHRTRTTGMSGAGVRWKVILDSGAQFHTGDLTVAAQDGFGFRTGPADRLAHLLLVAERPLGATRAKGTVLVESVRVEP